MEITVLILSAFITSSISAVIGMGGGIILLGIMAIIIPEGYMVIALHGIIQLVSNITRTYVFRKNLDLCLAFTFFAVFNFGRKNHCSVCPFFWTQLNRPVPLTIFGVMNLARDLDLY